MIDEHHYTGAIQRIDLRQQTPVTGYPASSRRGGAHDVDRRTKELGMPSSASHVDAM
jgi:hypothetical protein